jgi:hypothetical protein
MAFLGWRCPLPTHVGRRRYWVPPDRTGPDGKRQLEATPTPTPRPSPVRRSLALAVAHVNQVDKTKGSGADTDAATVPLWSVRRRRDKPAVYSVGAVWSWRGRDDGGPARQRGQGSRVGRIIVWLPQQPRATCTKIWWSSSTCAAACCRLSCSAGKRAVSKSKRGELDGDAVRSCRNSSYRRVGVREPLFSLDEGVVVRTLVFCRCHVFLVRTSVHVDMTTRAHCCVVYYRSPL